MHSLMRNTPAQIRQKHNCSDRVFSAEDIQDFSRDFDLGSRAYKQRTPGRSFHRSVQLFARQKWGHVTEGRTDFMWAQDSVCTKLLQGSKPNQSAKKPSEETVSNLKTDICLTTEGSDHPRQRSGDYRKIWRGHPRKAHFFSNHFLEIAMYSSDLHQRKFLFRILQLEAIGH